MIAKSNQTYNDECPQLDENVWSPYQRADHHIIRRFAGAENCFYRVGFKQADIAIRLWKARTSRTTQYQQARPST